MKKALIAPLDTCEHGCRIAQVENIGDEFEVCTPNYWIDCGDNVEADKFYFNEEDNTIKPIPVVEVKPENHLLKKLLDQLR